MARPTEKTSNFFIPYPHLLDRASDSSLGQVPISDRGTVARSVAEVERIISLVAFTPFSRTPTPPC